MFLEELELLVVRGHLTQHVQQTDHCHRLLQDLQGIASRMLVTWGKDVGFDITLGKGLVS